MSEYVLMARLFLVTGTALVVVGLLLWLALPIRPMFPPYLATAGLALGYGFYCRRSRPRPPGKS